MKWVFTIVTLFPGLICAENQKFATHFAPDAREVPAAVKAESSPTSWSGEAGPVANLRVYAKEKSGAIWLGSNEGAARFDAKARHHWDRWQYFYGRRWLLDDSVLNIYPDETSGGRKVWVRTKTGVSLIEWRPMTLEQKADLFEERVETRHMRHGMVADSHLRTGGDLSTSVKQDADNDGLWTAIYLGAQAYRYAVTRDPTARARAQRSVRLLMRLEEITGHPGFPARSFISTNELPP